MMPLLYNTGIYFYHLMIRVSALFNTKAKTWVNGRKDIFSRLKTTIDPEKPLVWFHAASLGEFEQGRPVIEAFRKAFPDYKILLTFFSPSGYEIRKNYESADYIFYLPIDSPSNARQFINIVNPSLAVFIKYEFWFNYIRQIHKNRIPMFVISAIFRKEQHFFKWYGGWFRNQLKSVNQFFVQNEASKNLLESIGINQVNVSGDTRFDRVASIAAQQKENAIAATFASGNRVILGGSTWPPDEKLLLNYLQHKPQHTKLIIAPHEIHKEHLSAIETMFEQFKTIRYSGADANDLKIANVLIIDGMGFLSSLYRYCDVAYIGGGFGKGIHNILEAVTFGKPVIFGPNYHKFSEAVNLIQKGGGFAIQNETEAKSTLDQLLNDRHYYQQASGICKSFITENTGATNQILAAIKSHLKI